eukprot:scaffold1108_cov387-Prasinococcus_capsulatus_cf.AAC.15
MLLRRPAARPLHAPLLAQHSSGVARAARRSLRKRACWRSFWRCGLHPPTESWRQLTGGCWRARLLSASRAEGLTAGSGGDRKPGSSVSYTSALGGRSAAAVMAGAHTGRRDDRDK